MSYVEKISVALIVVGFICLTITGIPGELARQDAGKYFDKDEFDPNSTYGKFNSFRYMRDKRIPREIRLRFFNSCRNSNIPILLIASGSILAKNYIFGLLSFILMLLNLYKGRHFHLYTSDNSAIQENSESEAGH